MSSARPRRSLDGAYTVLLCAAFAVVAAVMAVRSLAERPNPATGTAAGLVVAAALGCVSAALVAAAAFGPLSKSPADLMWLATSPISRGGLLFPRFTAVVGTGAVAGLAAVGVLVPRALFSGHAPYVVLIGVAAGVTTAAAAVVAQTAARDPARLLRGAAAVTGLAAVAAAGAVVTGRWQGGHVTGASLDGRWAVPALLAGALAAAAAASRLGRVRLTALRAAASSAGVLNHGAGTADPGLLTRVTEDRRWQRQRLRGRMAAPAGHGAIVVHDLLTLVRLPSRLLLVLALAATGGLLAGLAASDTVLTIGWLGSGLLAIGQFTGNVRYDADRPALARLLGLTGRRLLALRSVLPVALAVCWGALSIALVAGRAGAGVAVAAGLGAAAGPALAAGALRSARRSFVRHDYPLIVTPMGVVPSGPLLWLGQAVDVALIGTLPTLVALWTARVTGTTVAVQAAASALILTGFLTAGALLNVIRRL
jgi:hypothetical protein